MMDIIVMLVCIFVYVVFCVLIKHESVKALKHIENKQNVSYNSFYKRLLINNSFEDYIVDFFDEVNKK